MPRSPKGGSGGARQGTQGKAYSNRTDLNTPKLPVTTVPGQQYGAQTQQANAQTVIPMAGAPLGIGDAPSAPDPTQAPPYQGSVPGTLPDLFRPTERPNEPVMTGVDAGAGQGSEALAPNPFINTGPSVIAASLSTVPNPSPQVARTLAFLNMQQQNMMPH